MNTQHNNFSIERRYPVSPRKVFAAFADPRKKRRWFVEGEGFAVESFEMDFRVGGVERSSFRYQGGPPLEAGTPIANDTWYCDIVEGERIVCAYVMTVGGARISSSLATFEFVPDAGGTRLVYTEQAAFFEGADGETVRKQGWTALFDRLELELVNELAA